MPYSVKAVANLLINIARERNVTIDQMKLQKLVYISHGWNLAIANTPLISDEIQAWQYGPVIPVLYDEFKNCGRDPITDHATEININEETLEVTLTPPFIPDSDSHTVALANKVWDIYGELTGSQLSNLTHMENTPWSSVYGDSPRSNIPNALIQEHFKQLGE
ncbi:MAG: DUF4065 domain-containing protein [Mariprofundaceae bacterium]|nr:DUF4065 domain-containing protein [Mariprofundaceae bacterium]